MSAQIRGNSETGRLTVAALLAVVMHLSLAALPVNWRPILQQPTVLRVTLTAPPPTPTPPPPEPVTPIATITTPMAAPLAESASLIKPEPPAPAIAIARPSTAPKLSKVLPPKREPKRELPKPPPVVAQPKPAPLPKPKPLKPTAPPIITAKTPARDQKPLAQSEHSRRLVSSNSLNSEDKYLERSTDRNATRFDRRVFDDDLDLPLASARPARSVAKASGSDSASGSSTVASAAAARSAPIEVGLRPLPGNPQPRYPAEARQRGIEGKVVLRLTVSAAGSVEAASVARSSGNDLLDQEARLTVMRWRFQPLAGPKVAQIPISFRLQN
ncbi:MAG: energy transducer TonB [Candidatus Competibacter denitrificans]